MRPQMQRVLPKFGRQPSPFGQVSGVACRGDARGTAQSGSVTNDQTCYRPRAVFLRLCVRHWHRDRYRKLAYLGGASAGRLYAGRDQADAKLYTTWCRSPGNCDPCGRDAAGTRGRRSPATEGWWADVLADPRARICHARHARGRERASAPIRATAGTPAAVRLRRYGVVRRGSRSEALGLTWEKTRLANEARTRHFTRPNPTVQLPATLQPSYWLLSAGFSAGWKGAVPMLSSPRR